MKPIDLIGIRNFRIFSDEVGLFEKFSEINILTGSNNSGKSSIIKFLQMIKNSISENELPLILDLEQQEHLLGDFNNVLANPENREIEVSLPFNYFGLNSFFISLTYVIPEKKNSYKAKLRKFKVVYEKEKRDLFSFSYREATPKEKEIYQKEFENKLEEYKKRQEKKKAEREANNNKNPVFSDYDFLTDLEMQPTDDPLESYIEWYIDFPLFKSLLEAVLKFYNYYKDNKRKFGSIENIDNHFKETDITPSLFEKSYQYEISTENLESLINKLEKEHQRGKEPIGIYEFQGDYPYYPPPEIEKLFLYRSIDILKNKVDWKEIDNKKNNYSVVENAFKNSSKLLVQRFNSINYLSNIREENLRIYNSSINTPFIRLLKEYESLDLKYSDFIKKYVKVFEIGEGIDVKYTLKYQLLRILIKVDKNIERELVDFGYGIKQLILILIQIAVISEKNKRIKEQFDNDGEYYIDDYLTSTLIIEEPESSLHPKWQSKLAEMFVDASNKFNIQFVIETHSEYLIRKLQTLVADNKINGNKIRLFYLRDSKLKDNDKRQIDAFDVNSDGSIDYNAFDTGFFDENDNLELSLLNIQRERFVSEFEELKNKDIENNEKIEQLENKIDEYTEKQALNLYKRQAITILGSSRPKMNDKSFELFVSAKWLFANMQDGQNKRMDYSPVVIQCGRVIENELLCFFKSVKANILVSKGGATFIPPTWSTYKTLYGIKVASNRSGTNVSFDKYKKNYLENLQDVGNNAMWDTLAVIAVDETTRLSSDYKFMYNELVANFNNVSKKLLGKNFLRNIHKVIQYRNKAAHSDSTSKKINKPMAEDILKITEQFILTWILNKK